MKKLYYSLWIATIVVLAGFTVATLAGKSSRKPVTNNIQNLYVKLYKMLSPTVVTINTTAQRMQGGFQFHPFHRRLLEDFFGGIPQTPPAGRIVRSLGSGFIIDAKEGLIITNYHVVPPPNREQAITKASYEVLLFGKKNPIPAQVIGRDVEGDIALLKINTKEKLIAAPLGSSLDLEVGEFVMTIGNPLGLTSSITQGIVSAKGRVLPTSQFADYIQTDADINTGNSGGPLINTSGEVVGVNTVVFGNKQTATGIGFAIQVDYVKKILPDLKTTGMVNRGYIGIQMDALTKELKKNSTLDPSVEGVVVTGVANGNPAQESGMRPCDIILQVDGKPVKSPLDLTKKITSIRPGKTVRILTLRNGKKRKLSVRVGNRSNLQNFKSQRQNVYNPNRTGLLCSWMRR